MSEDEFSNSFLAQRSRYVALSYLAHESPKNVLITPSLYQDSLGVLDIPKAEEPLPPDTAILLRFSSPILNNNQLCTYCKGSRFSRLLGAADLNQQASRTILGSGAGQGGKPHSRGPGSEHLSNASLRKQAVLCSPGLLTASPLSLSLPPCLQLENLYTPLKSELRYSCLWNPFPTMHGLQNQSLVLSVSFQVIL